MREESHYRQRGLNFTRDLLRDHEGHSGPTEGRKHRHSPTRAHPSLAEGLSGGTDALVLQPAWFSVRQGDAGSQSEETGPVPGECPLAEMVRVGNQQKLLTQRLKKQKNAPGMTLFPRG